MIVLEVHFLGPVRRPALPLSGRMEVEAGLTVEAFLGRLGYSREERTLLWVTLNGSSLTLASRIDQGGVLQVGLVVGGG